MEDTCKQWNCICWSCPVSYTVACWFCRNTPLFFIFYEGYKKILPQQQQLKGLQGYNFGPGLHGPSGHYVSTHVVIK